MLAPHADKLFDRGWISFADNADLLIAADTPLAVMNAWGLSAGLNVGAFSAKQRTYLQYHRELIFRGPLNL
jgi:putative restriction endonuclease